MSPQQLFSFSADPSVDTVVMIHPVHLAQLWPFTADLPVIFMVMKMLNCYEWGYHSIHDLHGLLKSCFCWVNDLAYFFEWHIHYLGAPSVPGNVTSLTISTPSKNGGTLCNSETCALTSSNIPLSCFQPIPAVDRVDISRLIAPHAGGHTWKKNAMPWDSESHIQWCWWSRTPVSFDSFRPSKKCHTPRLDSTGPKSRDPRDHRWLECWCAKNSPQHQGFSLKMSGESG